MTAAVSNPMRRPRRRAPAFLLAIPSFIWYAFLFVIPVALVLIYSFGSKIAGSAGRVTLSNPTWQRYREIFDGPFFEVLKQTLRTSIIGTLLCLAIALPVAYFLAYKVSDKWKGVTLALLMVPFFTNYLLRTVAWKIVLQPRGLLSNFLQSEHWFTFGHALRDGPIQVLDTRTAVQLAVVYNYLPLMIFPLFVAFDRVELSMREAAKDLGSNRIRTFFQVTLPLAGPGVIAGLVLVFVPLSGDYVTAALLGGSKGNMLGAVVADRYFRSQDPASGAAIAVMLIVAILAVLAMFALWGLINAYLGRRARRVDVADDHAGASPAVIGGRASGASDVGRMLLIVALPLVIVRLLGSTSLSGHALLGDLRTMVAIVALTTIGLAVLSRRVGQAIFTVLVIGLLFVPIGYLVATSFNNFKSIFAWTRFSTRWWHRVFENEQMLTTVKNSFVIAAFSTAIALVLGTLAGVALARRPGRWTVGFVAVLLLILVTPEIMDGAGQLNWFNRLGWLFVKGLFPAVLAHSLFSSAVVTFIVRARVQGLDERLEEAATDLFATPRRAFFQITLPLVTPAVLAGGLLAFTFSLDNVVATTFVLRDADTFPKYVFGLAGGIIRPDVAAMATILLALTLVSLLVVALVLRRSGDSPSKIAATFTGN